jgi:uncharacterized protein
MTSTPVIADTGFWVALTNRSDRHHPRALEVLGSLERRLVSTWPVLTETCHLLMRYGGPGVQARFVEQWAQGHFDVFDLPGSKVARIETLMRKYADLPMDLADASLVVLAEELGSGDILSTDRRDFGSYRWKNREPFRNLLLAD